jgi:hypothetical protein
LLRAAIAGGEASMRSLTPSVARERLTELLSASRTRAAMLMHAFVDNRARAAEDLHAELAAWPVRQA